MRYILCLLVLCLPSLAWAQTFVQVNEPSIYPSNTPGNYIPLDGNSAVLVWQVKPSFYNAGTRTVIAASILPRFELKGVSLGSYGYAKSDVDSDISTIYTVIDSKNIYFVSAGSVSSYLNGIQSILSSKNLGTVQQRAAFIAGFKAKPPQIVNPGDILGTFTKMLGPWAYALVGMWIALIGLDLGTRNMKKVAGEAAKLERSARRTEINRQIKNDQTARVYQRKLRNMSHFLYTYTDRDDFYKDVRKRFKQTSADYAEYKASKGWIL